MKDRVLDVAFGSGMPVGRREKVVIIRAQRQANVAVGSTIPSVRLKGIA